MEPKLRESRSSSHALLPKQRAVPNHSINSVLRESRNLSSVLCDYLCPLCGKGRLPKTCDPLHPQAASSPGVELVVGFLEVGNRWTQVTLGRHQRLVPEDLLDVAKAGAVFP